MSAMATIWAASLGYTTAAPRGMETTNSLSRGRNTRYSPPADEAMLNPSRRPIRSSWSMEPRLVKNCLPAWRQRLWRRPFVSVSRTHSPSSSGPRCTPDQACGRSATGGIDDGSQADMRRPSHEPVRDSSDACSERLVDVVGHQHAVDAAVTVEQEVLRGRRLLHRQDERLAGHVRGERQPRLEGPRDRADR